MRSYVATLRHWACLCALCSLLEGRALGLANATSAADGARPAADGVSRDEPPQRRLLQADTTVDFRMKIGADPGLLAQRVAVVRPLLARLADVSVDRVTVRSILPDEMPMRRRLLAMGTVIEGSIAAPDDAEQLQAIAANLAANTTAFADDLGFALNETNVTVEMVEVVCASIVPPAGFELDTLTCQPVDIDECYEFNPCDPIALCINTVGSVMCACPQGTFGDGYTCAANTLAVRITLRTNASEARVLADFAAPLKELFAAMLETGNVTSTNASLASAVQGLLSTVQLADGDVLVSMDMLFGDVLSQHEAIERFDSLLFQLATDEIVARNASQPACWIGIEYGVRKATRSGDLVTSVVEQIPEGMVVMSAEFDYSCMVEGCWRIIVRYSGGSADTVSSVYLPKAKRTLENFYETAFIDTYNPNVFPCGAMDEASVSNDTYSQAFTGCCLPRYEDAYHVTFELQQYMASAAFATAMAQCDDTDATAAPPAHGLLVGNAATAGDFVSGNVQGMVSSRVDYKRMVSPDTNTHEIELLLDEEELRESMAVLEGNLNTQYTLKTFVGVAHFTPSPRGTFLRSSVQQSKLALRRTNYFTLSASGPLDFTVLDYSSAALHSVKTTTAAFKEVRVQYVEVVIVLNDDYAIDADGPFPLDGVRVAKGTLVRDAAWRHACHTAGGDAVYDDAATVAAFEAAKAQTTCAPQRSMCVQSKLLQGRILRLYVPLGVDFFNASELSASAGAQSVFVEVLTRLRTTDTFRAVTSVFRANIPLADAGVTMHCESVQAAFDLASFVDVDILVGTDHNFYNMSLNGTYVDGPPGANASANASANATRQLVVVDPWQAAGTYFPAVAVRNAASLTVPISAKSIESSMLTVVVRGDPGFFELTDRYYVDLNDVITMHFLEPAPVIYDLVMSLVATGGAFVVRYRSTGEAYIEATEELLSLCPFYTRANYVACVLRRDMYKASAVAPGRAAEVDAKSSASTRTFMQSVTASGSAYAADLGERFWRNVTRAFGINNRYVRAWSVNPTYSWQLRDVAGAGFSRYTLQTNFAMFALVALRDSTAPGAPQARRLLQAGGGRRGLLQTAAADTDSSAQQTTVLKNRAIEPIKQHCALFGVDLARCYGLRITLRIPLKRTYCAIETSSFAYDAMLDDITAAVDVTLREAGLQNVESRYVLPVDPVRELRAACAPYDTAARRRLLQADAELITDAEVLLVSNVYGDIVRLFGEGGTYSKALDVKTVDKLKTIATKEKNVKAYNYTMRNWAIALGVFLCLMLLIVSFICWRYPAVRNDVKETAATANKKLRGLKDVMVKKGKR